MKRTLLSVVQSVLNDMDSDPVDSISDTFESEQVAIIARDSFFEIIDRRNWPHLKQLIKLESSTTTANPTHVGVPENVKELLYLNYNMAKVGETQRKYLPVRYLHPDEFLLKTNPRNNDKANIDLVVDPSGVELLIRNDHRPQWWTSFNDIDIVLDSYDSDVDSTIQTSKLQAQGIITPDWTQEDEFIPFLPEEGFTLWLEETKSMAFINLKQMVNEKSEGRARKADSWLSRKAFVTRGGVRYRNYGRRNAIRGAHRRHPFDKDN